MTISSRYVAESRFVRSPRLATLAVAATLAGTGCGNYSNEDLEFMSAIPVRDDVAVTVPVRASLSTVGIADGWKTTLEVTRGFNGVADAFLSLIEKVRAYYPTSRKVNQRIWGPFPSDQHPGWRIEFRMTKMVDLPEPGFTYVFVMIPPPGVALPLGETSIISGTFAAAAGVRVGVGHLEVTLEEARSAGIDFRGLERLQHLILDYSTLDWPRRVKMEVFNLPPATPDDTAHAAYVYERAENGDGAMQFSFIKDTVPEPAGTPPLDESLMVESRWLGTGPGRADISVTGGNVVGTATALECWQADFRQSYQSQSWDPTIVGDESSCIPKL